MMVTLKSRKIASISPPVPGEKINDLQFKSVYNVTHLEAGIYTRYLYSGYITYPLIFTIMLSVGTYQGNELTHNS